MPAKAAQQPKNQDTDLTDGNGFYADLFRSVLIRPIRLIRVLYKKRNFIAAKRRKRHTKIFLCLLCLLAAISYIYQGGEKMDQVLKDRLLELRLKILQQHKIMMEFERREFEALFGRVNAGELLQLLINHAQFAWLRRMSEFVVLVDETLADKEFPMTDQNAEDYIAQARALFDPENPVDR